MMMLKWISGSYRWHSPVLLPAPYPGFRRRLHPGLIETPFGPPLTGPLGPGANCGRLQVYRLQRETVRLDHDFHSRFPIGVGIEELTVDD